jgi:ubiquinone/menaquinone biosynthesis C-methylase UbiE
MKAHHHEHAAAPHSHAHHHDRGLGGALRYLRLLPLMWRSEVNDAVVRELAIGSGQRVVDLGAGAGAATVAAADRGAQVLAVEPLPFMRSILSLRRLGHSKGRSISVHDGAAETIPAEDSSIDALWSVNTLHHWTNRDAAVKELARVLKPGAKVLLLDEDFVEPSHPEHDAARARKHGSGLVFDEVNPQALAESMKAAGFADAEGSKTYFAERPVKLVRATR